MVTAVHFLTDTDTTAATYHGARSVELLGVKGNVGSQMAERSLGQPPDEADEEPQRQITHKIQRNNYYWLRFGR